MATVLDLITEALVTVKALAVGESAPASMTTDALNKFNEVLEALSIQNLSVYTNVATTFPLVAGTGSYTIGPTGSVVTQRPPSIPETAFVTYSGANFPVIRHEEDEYARLSLPGQRGLPQWFIYDAAFPNAVVILWPVPDQAGTMTLYQNKIFTAATTIYDTFSMPPGYRRMIRMMLAAELVGDYPGMTQGEIEDLKEKVSGSIALVKRNNKKPELLRSEVSGLDCSGGSNYGNWRDGA